MATDAETLNETIKEVAAGPAATSVDSVSFSEHSLSDLIQAQKHLAGQAAVDKAPRGLRITKLNFGGSA